MGFLGGGEGGGGIACDLLVLILFELLNMLKSGTYFC